MTSLLRYLHFCQKYPGLHREDFEVKDTPKLDYQSERLLLGDFPLEDIKAVYERCFPHFVDGSVPITPQDRVEIARVVRRYGIGRSSEFPADRLVLETYLNKYREMDYLEPQEGPVYPNPPALPEEANPSDKYVVYPIGNILGKEGRFVIVDLSKVRDKEERLEIKNQLNSKKIEKLAKNLPPGKPLALGRCKLFCETSKTVFGCRQDLDFGQGSLFVKKRKRDILKNWAKKNWAKKLSLGDYTRIPKHLDEEKRKATSNHTRTTQVDRQETTLIVDRLEEEILKGHLDQLDWNFYLQINDYMAAVNHSDQRYKNMAAPLEEFLKGRALIECREKLKGRGEKYDLITAVKQLAETHSLFAKWVDSIRPILATLDKNKEMQEDFSWFEGQFHRVLPALESFLGQLPTQLVEMSRLLPEEIKNRYKDSEIEEFIQKTLECFDSPFYRTLPSLFGELQVARREVAFLAEALPALQKKYAQNREFLDAFDRALPNAFQFPSRVEMCIEGAAKCLTKPSPLQRLALSTYKNVKLTALESEKIRVDLSRELLTGLSKKEAFAKFYPTISPAKTT